MAESTKEKMNSSSEYVPSPWSRRTVADGAWMQKYTIAKLSARDNYLADQLDENVITISGDINTIDNKVETVSGDLNTVSSKLENMSPLTYRGNGTVAQIKAKTNKRNGDVYSVTGSPKSGTWWNGGSTKQGDDDFKVKNNDEVAYTSAGNKWFPIGQDYHVEYSAGQFIEVDNENYTIAISGCKPITFENPLKKRYDAENEQFVVNADFSEITAEKFNVYESAPEVARGLTYYNPTNYKLYYNPSVIENGNGISATTITASTATGASAKFISISGTTGLYENVNATSFSGRGLTISGNIVNNLEYNPSKSLILYYGSATNQDSTFSSNDSPKIVWSGTNANTHSAVGALAFSYFDTPIRYGTQLNMSYTENNRPGGWFDFTLIDGTNTKAGVLADSFSSSTMRTNNISANEIRGVSISGTSAGVFTGNAETAFGSSARYVTISATNISGMGANYFSKNTVFGVNSSDNDSTYNILWTNAGNTGSTKLWYTDSAFKVNPRVGRIFTPQLSATNMTAGSMYLISNGDVCGSAAGTPMIRVGTTGNVHMEIDGNELIVKQGRKK